MSISLATLGVICSNRAIGMATLGVICPSPVIDIPGVPSGGDRGSGPTSGIQGMGYDQYHEDDLLETRRKKILQEDNDIIDFIIAFVTKGLK